MLEHLNTDPRTPKRVVVVGGGGFVGGAALSRLEADGIPTLGLTRQNVDLVADGAADVLAGFLKSGDTLIMVAAVAPCKDNAMLVDNILMMKAVCAVLQKSDLDHVVYISSDAVYADDPNPLTEASSTATESLHGAMHLVREIMLREACQAPLAILRPSLLYGAADPHNGYGPNRFRRLAAKGEEITLFGEGEERRDHVLIDDVAEIMRLVVRNKSRGELNVATGEVASFREIAEMVVAGIDPPPVILGSERQGPMPHGGYRPFDIAATSQAFPGFRYTLLPEGIEKIRQDTSEQI